MTSHSQIKTTSVLKAAWLIAFVTVISKLVGFLRDVVVANYYGASLASDAYFYAYQFPALAVILLGGIGGPFHSAAVAVFTKIIPNLKEKPPEVAEKLFNTFVTTSFVFFTILTLLCFFFAKPIMALIISDGSPELINLASMHLKIMSPALVIGGLIGIYYGILVTYKEFILPSISPIIVSIVIIGTLFFTGGDNTGIVLATATVVGALCQLLLQIPRVRQLGFRLREMEFGHDMVKDQATNTCILISKVKAVQWFETTPHIRSKSVENIIKSLPTMLYSAYHENYKATEIPTKVILAIITKAVPELRAEEIVTAFCKTEFPKDLNPEVRQFALRIRAFIYELCGRMSEEELLNALRIASVSMTKFNERTNLNESFVNKYLDYRLLVNIYEDCKKNKAKFPVDMLKALQVIAKFIKKNVKFKPLF